MNQGEQLRLKHRIVDAYQFGIRPETTDEYIDVWVISHPSFSAETAKQTRDWLKHVAEGAARGLAPGNAQYLQQWLTKNSIPPEHHSHYHFILWVMNNLAKRGFWPLQG